MSGDQQAMPDDVTTIQLKRETKDRLDKRKTPSESYDAAVRRLLGETPGVLWTEAEIRELVRDELDRFQSRF